MHGFSSNHRHHQPPSPPPQQALKKRPFPAKKRTKVRKKTLKITTERRRSTIRGEEQADRDPKIEKIESLFSFSKTPFFVRRRGRRRSSVFWGEAWDNCSDRARVKGGSPPIISTSSVLLVWYVSDRQMEIVRLGSEISDWRGALYCGIVGLGSEISACCSEWAFSFGPFRVPWAA